MLNALAPAERRAFPFARFRSAWRAILQAVRETYDCQACGACCANPEENRAERFRDYVEVQKGTPLAKAPALLKQYAVRNARGVWHLRLVGVEQRCAALTGKLGERVSCAIYAERPNGCRTVEAGDRRCRQYRRERGIGVHGGD